MVCPLHSPLPLKDPLLSLKLGMMLQGEFIYIIFILPQHIAYAYLNVYYCYLFI